MTRHELLRRHAAWPLLAFAAAAIVSALTSSDAAIAHALFFDEQHVRWIGEESWFANELLHTGGRWFVRCIVAVALATLTAGFLDPALRPLRRASAYLALSIVLSVGVVGFLKMFTAIDCPWDLQEFGGSRAFMTLFAQQPVGIAHGRCFPAAHASSGYALMAFYFVLREYRAAWGRWALGAGLAAGMIFGVAQQSRGAHFLSHDLWSACIVWIIALSIYVYVFDARIRAPAGERSSNTSNETAVPGPRLPAPGAAEL